MSKNMNFSKKSTHPLFFFSLSHANEHLGKIQKHTYFLTQDAPVLQKYFNSAKIHFFPQKSLSKITFPEDEPLYIVVERITAS